MLHRPILRGRLGKWAYALIEYDLVFESLKTMKGQVVVDFIVEHWVDEEHDDSLSLDTNFISCTSWKLYFDGLACGSPFAGMWLRAVSCHCWPVMGEESLVIEDAGHCPLPH
jgi:hypothetical protein